MDIAQLSRMLENIIRQAAVLEIDHAQARCRVQSGGLISGWLPWFSPRAGSTRDWDPPTVGEQCLVISPSGELAGGFVLLGIYSDAHPAPSANPAERRRTYPDGAHIAYNHVTGALHATGIKSALLQAADQITIDCPQVTFTGAVTVQGLITYLQGMVGIGGENTAAVITGDVIANGISLVHHTHRGDSGGTTGQPQ